MIVQHDAYSATVIIIIIILLLLLLLLRGQPLWSSGQSSWLQIQRTRVQFSALPDFLRSSGSGTGSTQPREDNWGVIWIKSSGSGSRKSRLTFVGICCANQATPSVRKSWHLLRRQAAVARSVYCFCGLKPRSLEYITSVIYGFTAHC
jgi:hypothetical protein